MPLLDPCLQLALVVGKIALLDAQQEPFEPAVLRLAVRFFEGIEKALRGGRVLQPARGLCGEQKGAAIPRPQTQTLFEMSSRPNQIMLANRLFSRAEVLVPLRVAPDYPRRGPKSSDANGQEQDAPRMTPYGLADSPEAAGHDQLSQVMAASMIRASPDNNKKTLRTAAFPLMRLKDVAGAEAPATCLYPPN